MNHGERLRQWVRNYLKLKQNEFTELLPEGTSQQSVAKYFQGTLSTNAEYYRTLARLGVSISWLFDEECESPFADNPKGEELREKFEGKAQFNAAREITALKKEISSLKKRLKKIEES